MLPHQKGPPSASPLATSVSASKPINATAFRRFSTLLAIKLLKGFRKYEGSVLMLTDKICVKYGPHMQLSEASTMHFISENTSIPVPKVICAFNHSDQTYILMDRIKGEMIARGWAKRGEESKAKLLLQLKAMILEMRELRPPDNMGVASVDGGALYDCRISGPSYFGPFDTLQDFHRRLRMGVDFDPRLDSDVQNLIKQQDSTWPLKFTHGDLSSLNILVRDGDIVGIVDWETAGWYASYWEYTTAYQVNPQNSFWINEIDKFLDPMPQELEMEQIRQRRF